MHRSTAPAGGYGSLTASPSVFEENESCGDACARQLPSLEWIKAYDFAWLWNDVAGGITLGLVLLAQSLAHAHLAEALLQRAELEDAARLVLLEDAWGRRERPVVVGRGAVHF